MANKISVFDEINGSSVEIIRYQKCSRIIFPGFLGNRITNFGKKSRAEYFKKNFETKIFIIDSLKKFRFNLPFNLLHFGRFSKGSVPIHYASKSQIVFFQLFCLFHRNFIQFCILLTNN